MTKSINKYLLFIADFTKKTFVLLVIFGLIASYFPVSLFADETLADNQSSVVLNNPSNNSSFDNFVPVIKENISELNKSENKSANENPFVSSSNSNGGVSTKHSKNISGLNTSTTGTTATTLVRTDQEENQALLLSVLLNSADLLNTSIYSTLQINDISPNGPDLSIGDHYGSAIANIGDLNNDGMQDVAVGAWYANNSVGAVFVHFMDNNGLIKSTKKIDNTTLVGSINAPTITSDSHYGRSIAGLGDLDGDGVEDIAVGALWDSALGYGKGVVYIHFLNSDGSVKSTKIIDGNTNNGPTLNIEDHYGSSIANIGDVNGDQITDIAVGASGVDGVGIDRGGVFIHFLNSDGSIKETKLFGDSTGNGAILFDDDQYGSAVANIGDLNKDGTNDIAVGAYGSIVFGNGRGIVFIHFMGPNASILSTVEIGDLTENGPTLSDFDHYGRSIAGLGDIDGDNVIDLAVGANYDDNGAINPSVLYIHYMNENGSVKLTEKIDGNTPNGPVMNGPDDRYGAAVANVGDLNGDGKIELMVGDTRNDTGGENMGVVHIHFSGPFSSTDAGFTVSKTNITIDENGGVDTFDVTLTAKPTSNVVINISSSDTGNAVVDPSALTFTPDNWNIPQTVKVVGVDDNLNQNDTATITISINDALSDDAFDASADKTIAVVLNNNDDGGGSSSGGGGSSTKYACHDLNATNYNPKYKSKPSLCKYGEVLGASTTLSCEVIPYLTQPIKLGAVNNPNDVVLLEQYLNTYEGLNIPVDGVYSQSDFNDVVKWQEKYSQDILSPWGITKGTGYVFMTSLQKIKQVHAAKCVDSVKETQILSCSLPLLYPTKTITVGGQNDLAQVKLLERYLNTYENASIPVDGIYSQEDAGIVIKWQEKYANEILKPVGLVKGTGNIAQPSLDKIKKVHEKQCSLFVINPEF